MAKKKKKFTPYSETISNAGWISEFGSTKFHYLPPELEDAFYIPTPENGQLAKATAYLHTMTMEFGQVERRLTFNTNHPFGIRGQDFSAEYKISTKPLYTLEELPSQDLPTKIYYCTGYSDGQQEVLRIIRREAKQWHSLGTTADPKRTSFILESLADLIEKELASCSTTSPPSSSPASSEPAFPSRTQKLQLTLVRVSRSLTELSRSQTVLATLMQELSVAMSQTHIGDPK